MKSGKSNKKVREKVAGLEKSQLQAMDTVRNYIKDQESLSNKMHEMIEKLPERLQKILNDCSRNE